MNNKDIMIICNGVHNNINRTRRKFVNNKIVITILKDIKIATIIFKLNKELLFRRKIMKCKMPFMPAKNSFPLFYTILN